jgi:hypothetical protein
LVADQVADILPLLRRAMAPVEEHEKEMKEAQPHNL